MTFFKQKNKLQFMVYLLAIISILLTGVTADIQQINLIINGKFTNPGLPPSEWYHTYPNSIEGWSCTANCEIVDCGVIYNTYPTVNKAILECTGYVLDLNSLNANEEITQKITLEADDYWFQFDYIYPQTTADKKSLEVFFNGARIFLLAPVDSTSILNYKFQYRVSAQDGVNRFSVRNSGYLADSQGFKVGNFSLNREINSLLQNIMSNYFQLQFLKKSNSFPGGRRFFGGLLSFMMNFDRLQFYQYHNRQYSRNSRRLLQKVQIMQQIKSNLFKQTVKEMFPGFVEVMNSIFSPANIKKDYMNYNVTDEQQRQQTLISYLQDFSTFSAPFIIIIYIVLHILFRILRKWAISIIVRQYAFYFTLLMILLEGNIEELVFHCFAELQLFFSSSIGHKILNCLVIYVLFFVTFVCYGLFYCLKFYYGVKTVIIADTEKSSFDVLSLAIFDRGVILFLFGVTHQMLLYCPTQQMAILLFLQFIWSIKRTIAYQHYKKKLHYFLWLSESFLRIYFQITTLFFTFNPSSQNIINTVYHFYLIIAFITIVSLQFIVSIFLMMKHLIESPIFRKNSLQSKSSKSQTNSKQVQIKQQGRQYYLNFKKTRKHYEKVQSNLLSLKSQNMHTNTKKLFRRTKKDIRNRFPAFTITKSPPNIKRIDEIQQIKSSSIQFPNINRNIIQNNKVDKRIHRKVLIQQKQST